MSRLQQVFGIRTGPVLSYVDREAVDDRFESALSADEHIVVYGSSKQGKTSLRQTYVSDDRCVIVRCNPRMSIESIYQSVLRQANIRLETVTAESMELSGTVHTKVGFRAFIPWIGGAGTEVDAGIQHGRQKSLTTEFVSYDFGDAQAIAELLQKANFGKFIVLENFHYLPIEVQKSLAFDLKTFHEIGIRFIVLGIWHEANLLTTHNGDLQDRIVEVPVEPWELDDFDRIVEKGCCELGILIEGAVVSKFKANAFGNVGLFQEFLETFCRLSGVTETRTPKVTLGDQQLADKALEEKLTSQRGQLLKNLQGIAAQCRIRSDESDPLLLPYYLVLFVLHAPIEQLRDGVERTALLEGLRGIHHRPDKDKVRMSDLTNLLQGLPRLQKDINPPLFYYDPNSRRLKIVDTRQFFVLSKSNREELIEEIPYPATVS